VILLEVSFFEITKYITHPISLVAYVCALITYFFISRNINDRKKLEANPEAYRATAERLDIKFTDIAESERGTVTLRMLNNRILSQLILAGSIIIGGLIIAYISINYLQTTTEEQKRQDASKQEQLRVKDSISESHRRDSLNIISKQDSVKLTKERQLNRVDLIIKRGKGIVDSILIGQEMAWKVSFFHYSNDVMNVISEIEKARNDDRKYNTILLERGFAYKRTMYEDNRSQRIEDSAHAINETRFYLRTLEEFRTTL